MDVDIFMDINVKSADEDMDEKNHFRCNSGNPEESDETPFWPLCMRMRYTN